MTEAFICDAIRTPIGRYGGALATVRADDLGAVPLRALMTRNPQVDWTAVEDIIYGCANQAGEDNRNVARMSGLLAGLPIEVPGTTVNRLCGSGMDATGLAARSIKSGETVAFAERSGRRHGDLLPVDHEIVLEVSPADRQSKSAVGRFGVGAVECAAGDLVGPGVDPGRNSQEMPDFVNGDSVEIRLARRHVLRVDPDMPVRVGIKGDAAAPRADIVRAGVPPKLHGTQPARRPGSAPTR